MARPSQNLTASIRVRLTPEERAQLERDAETAAVDLSTMARAQLMNAPIPKKARRTSNADEQALARILGQLGKIGGNLNQLAKAANSNGDLTAARNVEALRKELAGIREEVRRGLHP